MEHPNTFAVGNYTVQCAYGTSSQPFDDMTAGCYQQMSASVDEGTSVCESMDIYDANGDMLQTIADNDLTSIQFSTPQSLSFICQSSIPNVGLFGFKKGND